MRENSTVTYPRVRAPPGPPAPVPAPPRYSAPPRHCEMADAGSLFCFLMASCAAFALSSLAAAVPRLRTRRTAGPGGAAGPGWVSSFLAAERKGRVGPGFPGPGLRRRGRARTPAGPLRVEPSSAWAPCCRAGLPPSRCRAPAGLGGLLAAGTFCCVGAVI